MTKHLKGLRLNAPAAPAFTDILGNDLAWVTPDALCSQVDPELWFPKQGDSSRSAKAVCRACPLLAQCSAYALSVEGRNLVGVWGGLSEIDRRQLRGAPCGTLAGYKRHTKNGEPTCGPCKAANAADVARRRQAKRGAA